MEELFSNALKSVKSNRVLYTASFFARSSLFVFAGNWTADCSEGTYI